MNKEPKISINSTVGREKDLVGCDIDDDIIIMSIANGEYYNFNAVASKIWKFIEEPHSVSSLINELLDSYHVSREECEKSIINYLEKLRLEALIYVDPELE